MTPFSRNNTDSQRNAACQHTTCQNGKGCLPLEQTFPFQQGFPPKQGVLAGLAWGNPDKPWVIALHGWLDNAASFTRLAPLLADDYYLLALDLPGHGHSSHRDTDGDYGLLNYVTDVARFIDAQVNRPFHLLGHSLGGIIASLFASAFPEKMVSLTMIDSLGPYVAPEDQFATRLRKAVSKRIDQQISRVPVYACEADAIHARSTGLSALSTEAAGYLVPRNLIAQGNGLTWRTDPRLRYPSMMQLSERQVTGYLASLTMPCLFMRAKSGMMPSMQHLQNRIKAVPRLTSIEVEGNHHCHLDAGQAGVAQALRDFWQQPG